MSDNFMMNVIMDKCKNHSTLTNIEYDELAKILNLLYGDLNDKDDKDCDIDVEYPMNLIYCIFGYKKEIAINDAKSIKEVETNIEYILDNLMEAKEANVLRMRFRGKLTLEEIAKGFGVSKERIRIIENKALRKMRHPMRAKAIFSPFRLSQEIKEKTDVLTLKKNELSDLITESMNHIKILSDALNNIGIEVKTDVKTEISYSLPLDEVGFSVRTYNCLKRGGYNTIKDICNATELDVMQIRNLGRRSLQEIRDKLLSYGLSFKSDDEQDNLVDEYSNIRNKVLNHVLSSKSDDEKEHINICDNCDNRYECQLGEQGKEACEDFVTGEYYDDDGGLCENCVHFNGFGNKCTAGFLCNTSVEGCKYYHEI